MNDIKIDSLYKDILKWIENNLESGNKIDNLISSINQSRRTIEKLFLKKSGLTLGGYFLRRKMSRAAVLLRLSNLSISEIAVLLSYSSSQNFSRAFKNCTRKTPTEYRNSKCWDMSTIQLSLLYHIDLQDIKLCKLPDFYLSGEKYCISESFFYTNRTTAIGIRKLILDKTNRNKCDLFISIQKIKKTSVQKSRSGFIEAEIIAGNLSKYKAPDTVSMKGGKFWCCSFLGTWEEYYSFTFEFFMKIYTKKRYHFPESNCFIHFFKTSASNIVNCIMYIPVNTGRETFSPSQHSEFC
ncbi:TPA: helix-turn-helix transcriptional regulator [Escherichia coli]|nr:helix-turn-helix transcriptional regulator [Escherichia coli]